MLRCDWRISILAVLVSCFLGGPLSFTHSPKLNTYSRTALMLCFLIVGIHASGISIPPFPDPVNVFRVKSYVNRLFDRPCVCTNEDHNQYTLLHSKVGGVQCCGSALKRRRSGMGTGESDV